MLDTNPAYPEKTFEAALQTMQENPCPHAGRSSSDLIDLIGNSSISRGDEELVHSPMGGAAASLFKTLHH